MPPLVGYPVHVQQRSISFIGIIASLAFIRTFGIAACPLNRRLTRLSIPLGFLHDGSTPGISLVRIPLSIFQDRFRDEVPLTFESVGLMAVEALLVCSIEFR